MKFRLYRNNKIKGTLVLHPHKQWVSIRFPKDSILGKIFIRLLQRFILTNQLMIVSPNRTHKLSKFYHGFKIYKKVKVNNKTVMERI